VKTHQKKYVLHGIGNYWDLDDFDCQQVDDLHQLGLGLK